METLAVMRRLVNEAVNDPAFQVGHIEPETVEWFDNYIRAIFRYRPELEEIVRTPQRMLQDFNDHGFMEGDCDDISTFYAAALKSSGIPVRFVAIRYDETPDFKHVFIEANVNGQWRRFDPTVPCGTVHQEIERMVLDV